MVLAEEWRHPRREGLAKGLAARHVEHVTALETQGRTFLGREARSDGVGTTGVGTTREVAAPAINPRYFFSNGDEEPNGDDEEEESAATKLGNPPLSSADDTPNTEHEKTKSFVTDLANIAKIVASVISGEWLEAIIDGVAAEELDPLGAVDTEIQNNFERIDSYENQIEEAGAGYRPIPQLVVQTPNPMAEFDELASACGASIVEALLGCLFPGTNGEETPVEGFLECIYEPPPLVAGCSAARDTSRETRADSRASRHVSCYNVPPMAGHPDNGDVTAKDKNVVPLLDPDATAPDCRPSMVDGLLSAEEASRRSESFRKRYEVREDDDGRYLRCIEAPNIAVRIERGLTVSSGAAKRAPEGTIYLDGAAAGEPFMDVQRRVYNLDHHEGCVRSFTLATCEQAMVMVLKGLDLRSGEWTLWANEPDLDTVLAIWVLLNHMRLAGEESDVRRSIMPVLRLEGAIDAGGLKFAELCAFPDDLHQRTMQVIHNLRVEELAKKTEGSWGELDFLEYTANVLRFIDGMIYSPCDFDALPDIDEIARVQLNRDRLAVICRAGSGIYEVERGLAHLHGDRVGIVILQKTPDTYTVRQVDSFMPTALTSLYDRLNMVDPAVTGEGNRWGGSAEIGGSPRRSGTKLSPQEIGAVIDHVYHPPTPGKRFGAVAGAVGAALTAILLALTGAWLNDGADLDLLGLTSFSSYVGSWLFILVLLGLSVGGLGLMGWRERHRFGLSLPRGWHWIPLVGAAGAAGALGGAWMMPVSESTPSAMLPLLLLPLISEALHRGMIHGKLSARWNTQHVGGKWFFSPPTVISGLLSASLSTALFLPAHLATSNGGWWWLIPSWTAGAVLLGLGCGLARERSASLLPPILIHLLAAAWLTYLPSLV